MPKRMYFQGFQRVLGVFVSSVLLVSPAMAGDARKQIEKETVGETLVKPETHVQAGLAGSFLSGRFAKQNKDLTEAAKFLNDTLKRDPDNEILQQDAMRMSLLAGDITTATQLARSIVKKNASDPLVANLLMLDAIKANDFTGAKAAINASSGAGLFGLIRPVMMEWVGVAANESKRPIDMKAAIDKAGFFAPFINYHAALMNDVTGNAAAAQVAYAKSNVDPAVTPYRVVEALANFYQRQGKIDQAQAVYDAYAKANPQSTLLPDKLDVKQVPKPMIADAKQGIAELYFTTASILFGEEATQDTFLYLRLALDLRPDLPPAQLMLANLYEQVEDYKQAIATYDAIPEGTVFYRRAQIRKALNYEALGQKDKAVSLLDALAARYPNDAVALISKGDMLREAKKYADAAQSYSMAIARTEPLGEADWPLLYARGISYERANMWGKAEADFTRALSLSPEQPDVLNYLGYSWLTMNKNLTKARKYLESALEQRPDDAHIMDSVGWAYYLTGDFKSAVEKFEQAIELMPDDVTINEHLGDAYWRVDRKTEARFQWERALIFQPEKDVAEELRNKLAKGMPAFVPPAETTAKKPQATAVVGAPAVQVP